MRRPAGRSCSRFRSGGVCLWLVRALADFPYFLWKRLWSGSRASTTVESPTEYSHAHPPATPAGPDLAHGLRHLRRAAAARSPVPRTHPAARALLAAGRHHRFRAVLLPVVLPARSEEHTSELQSLMRISSAVFCLQ